MVVEQAQDNAAIKEVHHTFRGNQSQDGNCKTDKENPFDDTHQRTQKAVYFTQQFNFADDGGENFT